jgi:hypothetical protein
MMTCSDCSASLDDVPVNELCPNCGGERRDATVFPKTAHAKAQAPRPTLRIGYEQERPWQQKWQDLVDRREQIRQAYVTTTGLSNEQVRRIVEHFFAICRELADWLKQNAGLTQALDFVTSDPYLRLCDAVAQTTKHHTREGKDPISARVMNISTGPHGISVEIEWTRPSGDNGSADALDLAERCVAAWQRYINRSGSGRPQL